MGAEFSGVVTITNLEFDNRVTLSRDSHAEPLVCIVREPVVSEIEQWELRHGSAGRYQIWNVKHNFAASVHATYDDEPQVVSFAGKYWWYLERVSDVQFGPNAYMIRPASRHQRHLCWSLSDGDPETPIHLQPFAMDRRKIWRISPYDTNTKSGVDHTDAHLPILVPSLQPRSIGDQDPTKRDIDEAASHTTQELDDMYKQVLEEVMPGVKREEIIPMLHSVLGQIVISQLPLSTSTLIAVRQHFPSEGKEDKAQRAIDVEPIVRSLGALLVGTADDQTPIRPLHASFYSFLLDKERSGNFSVEGSSENHRRLAFASLQIMKIGLRFNICRLESSYVSNSAVSNLQERVARFISPELQYSCQFWTYHVQAASFDSALAKEVHFFFDDERILFWLEVLSLTKNLSGTASALSSIASWFPDSDDYLQVKSTIADTERFVRMSAATILRSTPHLYLSALSFAPTSSHISRKFSAKFPRGVRITAGRMTRWSSVWTTMHGHADTVNSVAISHNWRLIVSGANDDTIRIWDAETGELACAPLRGHTGSVYSVAISHDGRRIVSGSWDKTVRIWDAQTGNQLGNPLSGHTNWVTSVAISHDGRRIVSGSNDATIRVWDLETGELLGVPLKGHTDWVTSVAISQDGKSIVSGSWDKTVRVWSAETGQPLGAPLQGHADKVKSVAISHDGRHVVSGSMDKTIRIWNTQTGKQLGAPLEGHTGSVESVAISNDGHRIVSGSSDETIRIWDIETTSLVGAPLRAHKGWVTSVAISSDGHAIVSGSKDTSIRVWGTESNAETQEAPAAPLKSRPGMVFSLAISPDRQRIISGSDDGTIHVWHSGTGQLVGIPLKRHTGFVHSLAISHDGQRLVSGSEDNTICVWDLEAVKALGLPFKGHIGPVRCVAISHDGRLVVSGSEDAMIRVWNSETGQLKSVLKGHAYTVTSVAISYDGQRIISGSYDNTIRVWDAGTGQLLGVPLEGHTNCITSVAISHDGRRIVSGSADNTIRVWDASTGDMLGSPFEGHTNAIFSVAISDDSRWIASGSCDKTVRVWDMSTGLLFGNPFEGHTDVVMAVTFLGDKLIVSGSMDATIRTWEIGVDPAPPDDKSTLPAARPPHHRPMWLKKMWSRISHHVKARDAAASVASRRPAQVQGCPGIRFSSNPVHALRLPSLTLPLFFSRSLFPDEQGWLVGPSGELLFWVPVHLRARMWVPANTLVIPDDALQLDLSSFAHGFSWHECRGSYHGV
ncbi:uncharacterized protein FIBRA_03143 [Fibroporia radiculosa]|uniref:Uncharacterized protein n=1 Tax=Fibroporia radiculosa TaxID=599839 RepID=J4GNB4_9APHY|nr:uncharacterized protein FIBRA_03143 [Fibroporia radiculosa]CCM01095.1 predicted protein [Fibroporia radiculosa]